MGRYFCVVSRHEPTGDAGGNIVCSLSACVCTFASGLLPDSPVNNISDPLLIAVEELKAKKIPITIRYVAVDVPRWRHFHCELGASCAFVVCSLYASCFAMTTFRRHLPDGSHEVRRLRVCRIAEACLRLMLVYRSSHCRQHEKSTTNMFM
jgi:hypothetical protein